jgi:hypothetical protein
MKKKRKQKKQTPEQDDQQLYGHETRLIDTHGVENPGPDQGQFPTPSDQPLQEDQASERETEVEPAHRQRRRLKGGKDDGQV